MERALAIYTDRFSDLGDATFVFVGAFEWDQLRSLVEVVSRQPADNVGRTEQWVDTDVDPPTELDRPYRQKRYRAAQHHGSLLRGRR